MWPPHAGLSWVGGLGEGVTPPHPPSRAVAAGRAPALIPVFPDRDDVVGVNLLWLGCAIIISVIDPQRPPNSRNEEARRPAPTERAAAPHGPVQEHQLVQEGGQGRVMGAHYAAGPHDAASP